MSRKFFIVPVNARYKEFWAIEAKTPWEAKDLVKEGGGISVEELFEFAETLNSDLWDDPEEVTEEAYEALFKKEKSNGT